MRKLNLADVPRKSVASPKGNFAKERCSISVALGARDNPVALHPFEIELVTLPPSKRFCPYHSHTAEHELYIVVSGAGEVRHPGGLEPIGPGDCFHFPPGEAHQLINSGADPLVYYVVANNAPVDDCYYPDSDKWAIDSLGGTVRHEKVDYYDGEE